MAREASNTRICMRSVASCPARLRSYAYTEPVGKARCCLLRRPAPCTPRLLRRPFRPNRSHLKPRPPVHIASTTNSDQLPGCVAAAPYPHTLGPSPSYMAPPCGLWSCPAPPPRVQGGSISPNRTASTHVCLLSRANHTSSTQAAYAYMAGPQSQPYSMHHCLNHALHLRASHDKALLGPLLPVTFQLKSFVVAYKRGLCSPNGSSARPALPFEHEQAAFWRPPRI